MSTAPWQLRPTKLHAYEALQTMNRCFEATLLSLERLEHLGLFRLEFLNAYRVTLEYTRAQANDELMRCIDGNLSAFANHAALHPCVRAHVDPAHGAVILPAMLALELFSLRSRLPEGPRRASVSLDADTRRFIALRR